MHICNVIIIIIHQRLFLGIFLIPYFLVMIFCGIPLLYLELAIGQFTKRGPISAISKLCPILKGKSIIFIILLYLILLDIYMYMFYMFIVYNI